MKRRVHPIVPLALAAMFLVPRLRRRGRTYLMPTPNLYADGLKDPFPEVSPELRNNQVEVFYLTDRKEARGSTEANRLYGFERSRSVAYGTATMEIGEDIPWEELVRASTTRRRARELPLRLLGARELGRFAPTPQLRAELLPVPVNGDAAKERAQRELGARLARCRTKDVYLYVHGYNNDFNDSIMKIGQLWHFMGRQGVPIAYSWPAGSAGLLRGYTSDRESSEFTVLHFKEALRTLAELPEVHRIHIIAHSRGTDVAASALRELELELGAAGRSTRDALKLGSVILAAPDLDFEVIMQRGAVDAIGLVPERFALYVCQKDKALGLSNWLFGGSSRLGKLRSDMLTLDEMDVVRKRRTSQIIDARIKDPGPHGHGYFYANPAVSSDVILTVRYGELPGSERPLRADPEGFWYIDDNYPTSVTPAADRLATASGNPHRLARTESRAARGIRSPHVEVPGLKGC